MNALNSQFLLELIYRQYMCMYTLYNLMVLEFIQIEVLGNRTLVLFTLWLLFKIIEATLLLFT